VIVSRDDICLLVKLDEGIVGNDTQHKETDNRVTSAGCPDTMPREEIRKIL
jgi:hypothetical protein